MVELVERTSSGTSSPPPSEADGHFTAAVAETSTSESYTVKPGDTLCGIAASHKTRLKALEAANPDIANPDLIHPGESIALPQPAVPHPVAPQVTPALAKPGADAQAVSIATAAQNQSSPEAAVKTLGNAYASATPQVQAAVMANPGTQRIVDNAAHWADEPLSSAADAISPGGQVSQALGRLDHITQTTNKALAGAVADKAADGYRALFKKYPSGALIGNGNMPLLMDLSGRIAGTSQGNSAIDKFAKLGAWNSDAVRNTIGAGGSLAYPLAMAQTMKEAGQDPSIVTGAMTDGVKMFQEKTDGDVKSLASHDAELSWVLKNQGAGMTPSQIAGGMAGYMKAQGADWQKQQTQLQSQVSQDGATLLAQMQQLNAARGTDGLSTQQTDATLKGIVDDPASNLAISTALKTDPSLTTNSQASSLQGLFTAASLGRAGKSLTEQLATAYVRQNLLGKLQGLHLQGKDSMLDVQTAKAEIEGLAKGPMAKLLGISQSQMEDAVGELKNAVLDTQRHGGDAAAEAKSLAALNDKFNTDPQFSKAFNEKTFAGQLMRGIGVAFAGVGLYQSAGKAAADPSNLMNDANALLSAAGFVQKSADALTSLGAISKESALGQVGGAWKLGGKVGVSDLIGGIGSVLSGISAVQEGFGIGQQQNIPEAVFTGLGAVGGGMMVAGGIGEFAGASLFGPIGAGLAAVGIVGDAIYNYIEGQHQYEGAGQSFLAGAGYDPAASQALSRQVDGGKAMMPILDRYASLTGLSPTQEMDWVNGLSPAQANSLGQTLSQAVSDSGGKTQDFTNGPPQYTKPVYVPRFIDNPSRELDNTVKAFQQALRDAHVPLPVGHA